MSLVVLASAKGAPGVTTAATALAHVWPEAGDSLLVEVDPAGGDLAARLILAPEPGLATLAARAHRSDEPVELSTHLQSERGLRILPAPTGRAAGRAAAIIGPDLGALLAQLAGDVIVDVGRLDGTGPDAPVGTGILAAAGVVAVLCRATTADLAHAGAAVADLVHAGLRPGLVLVGEQRDVHAARFLDLPVFGTLPHDPRGADALGGAPIRPWLLERLPLVRAARVLAATLAEVARGRGHAPTTSVIAAAATRNGESLAGSTR